MQDSVRFLRPVLADEKIRLTVFPSSVEALPGDSWRLFYSAIRREDAQTPHFSIGMAEGPLKALKPREFRLQSGVVRESSAGDDLILGNLPEGWMPIQPIHLKLSGGGHRLYFWTHCPAQGIVRFLAAESENGRVYHVLDPHRPCLYHYCDRATPVKNEALGGLVWNTHDGERPPEEPIAPPEKICNDATTLYQLRDGSFELFSAVIRQAAKDTPEFIPHDNAAGWRRYIRRWKSRDGLDWEADGIALDFDEKDAPYHQFYYLASHERKDGSRVGIYGKYDVLAQTMRLGRAIAPDGRHWQRPERDRAVLPLAPDELGHYASCNPVVPTSEGAYLFYSSCTCTHNGKYCASAMRRNDVIKCAILPMGEWE